MKVARCQSDSGAEVVEANDEGSDLGIVGEDALEYGDGSFSPASGVDTVCVFPKNSARRMHLRQCSFLFKFSSVYFIFSVSLL